jgi:hypothetical protein
VGEIIQRMVPTAALIHMGSDADRRNYRVNFSKIRDILGFVPEHTVEQGVAQVIDAIRSGRIVDYHDARYSNVKFLGTARNDRRVRCENGWVQELLKPTVVIQAKMREETPIEEPLKLRAIGE